MKKSIFIIFLIKIVFSQTNYYNQNFELLITYYNGVEEHQKDSLLVSSDLLPTYRDNGKKKYSSVTPNSEFDNHSFKEKEILVKKIINDLRKSNLIIKNVIRKYPFSSEPNIPTITIRFKNNVDYNTGIEIIENVGLIPCKSSHNRPEYSYALVPYHMLMKNDDVDELVNRKIEELKSKSDLLLYVAKTFWSKNPIGVPGEAQDGDKD